MAPDISGDPGICPPFFVAWLAATTHRGESCPSLCLHGCSYSIALGLYSLHFFVVSLQCIAMSTDFPQNHTYP